MTDNNELSRLRAEVARLTEELAESERCNEWNKKRWDLLQKTQTRMRDPERTMVCDILANAALLPDKRRYAVPADPEVARLREALAQIGQVTTVQSDWCRAERCQSIARAALAKPAADPLGCVASPAHFFPSGAVTVSQEWLDRQPAAEPVQPAGEVCRWSRDKVRTCQPGVRGKWCGQTPEFCPGCGRRVEVVE